MGRPQVPQSQDCTCIGQPHHVTSFEASGLGLTLVLCILFVYSVYSVYLAGFGLIVSVLRFGSVLVIYLAVTKVSQHYSSLPGPI